MRRTPFPGTPDGSNVCVKGGFDARVLLRAGLCRQGPEGDGRSALPRCATSVSFFRNRAKDGNGTANPVFGRSRTRIGSGCLAVRQLHEVASCTSASTRTSSGKQVFDGVYAQIAARQTNLNTRFADSRRRRRRAHRPHRIRPGRNAWSRSGLCRPSAGRSDGGIMKRCDATKTCPKLFVGFSGTEFWDLQGSPLLTDPGAPPIWCSLPTRASTTTPARITCSAWGRSHRRDGRRAVPTNGNLSATTTVRALYQDLEEWVVRGPTPPDSQVPKLAERDAGAAEPGRLPGDPRRGATRAWSTTYPLLDWGPQYKAAGRVRHRDPAAAGVSRPRLRDPGAAGRCRRQRHRRHPQRRRRRAASAPTRVGTTPASRA